VLRKRLIVAVALVGAAVALVAVAGCGGGGAQRRAAADPPPAQADPPAAASCPQAGASDVDGGHLRMPAGARPGSTPLIVVLVPGGHGDRSDRLGVGAAATKQGFAVLYPTSDDTFWALNHDQGDADVDAVTGLLDRTLAGGCFDARRISITGVSNGAGFAARMACALPERFAAVVPVAAGYRALDPCPATARASFLDIHGSADTVVPYNGKKPDRAGSVPRYTARWARRDGCAARPAQTTPRRLVTRVRYRGCDPGLRVERLRLSGTDHGWPGAGPPLPDRNPSGVNATRELLRFVATAHR
jgi:polyhydroxybutyrate depolymerase